MASRSALPVKNVALVGGSGFLGSYILKVLTENNFNITVISRKSSNIFFLPQIKVFRISDSYPQDELLLAFRDQDAVIVSISPRSSDAQYQMVDAAVLAGVRRFIPNNWGSNAENPAVLDLQPKLAAKAEIVEYLKTKELTGLTWTSVVPGFFVDKYFRNGMLGFKISTREAMIWGSGDCTFSAGTSVTAAESVAKVLLHQDQTANRYIYVSAIETTQNEILASLEKHTGARWRISRGSIEEFLKSGKEGIARGDSMSIGYLAIGAMYSGRYGGDFAKEGKLANGLLNLSGQTLDEIVAGAISGHE